MEKLNPTEEAQIARFADRLTQTQTVEDMFPPDGGVVVALPETNPRPPLCDQLCLAAVYDLAAMRRRRNGLLKNAGDMLIRIDALIEA